MQIAHQKIKKCFFTSIEIILVLLLLLGNSSFVLAEEIVDSITSASKAKALIETSISKYNNFSIGENRGTLLQFNVKTGIEYEEDQNYGAIKNTTTLIKIPEINGQLPQRVETIAKSTKATNGQTQEITGNYSYDAEKGVLQIVATNEGEEPYNQYDKTARDEYEVICIYSEDLYTESNEERSIEIQAVVQEELYNEEIGTITEKVSLTQTVTENISDVVSTEIQTQDIYDGYIKSNYINGTEYETTYKESMNILVSYKELGDKLVLEQDNNWENANEEEIKNIDNVIYKSTKICKQDMLKILGEEGYIKIISDDGTVLQEINKDTEETEEGIIEITYPENTEHITIETSKPVKEGSIRFENTKAIKNTVTDLQAKSIRTNQTISNEQQVISTSQKVTEIKSAQTTASLTIDNNSLTNGVTNNVVLTATLKTNNNAQNLFKDPKLKITIPAEAEKVILGDVSIVHGEGFEIASSNVIENEDGTKEIEINLTGNQSSYSMDTNNEGTSVVIPLNIVLSKELTQTESVIKASCTNQVISENGYIKEEQNCEDIAINMINAVQTAEANETAQTEETLTEKTEQTVKSTKVKSVTLPDGAIELNAYAQIGSKKINNGDSIHTDEIIKYVISVKNTTDTTINDATITCQIPENTVYATVNIGDYLHSNYSYEEQPDLQEYTFTAETLEPGETKTGYYEVVVKGLEEDIEEKQISNNISVKVGDTEYSNTTLENKIINSNIKIFLKSYIEREEENRFVYFLDVTNTSDEVLNNIAIETSEFQKEMNILGSYYYSAGQTELQKFGNTSNGKLEGVIDFLDVGETKTIEIDVEAYNFDDNVNEVPLIMTATAYTNSNDIYYSNENRRNAYPRYVSLKMSLDKEGEEVQAGEEITYKLEIKNESKIRAKAHVYDYLPEEVQGISLEYENYHIEDDEFGQTMYDIEAEANIAYTTEKIEKDISATIEGKPIIDEYLEIPAGKTVVMTIKAKTWDYIETKEVANYAVAERLEEKENVGIKTVSSNIVKFKLLAAYTDNNNVEGGGEGGSGTTIAKPYSISGVAWLDENQDGRRDSAEPSMSNIQVKLYDVNTQAIAKDKNGNVQKTTTDSQGKYTFNNINNGNYWVLFEYDSNNYSLTAYQKSGILSTLNSDVIMKDVAIDGVEKRVAMTDTLTISDNGLSNIDMGLIRNSTFNLKLDKYISQVKVETKSGTKIYNYDNTQFAKIEIKSREIQNSTLTIEYKIILTNVGDTEGFASKVVDQIPQGFTFDTSLNKGWVKDSNGNIVNTSLSSEFIAPGEQKQLTVTIKKQLTGDSTGTVINTANIGESRSVSNLSDNNQSDNTSKAELLISIETGALAYTIMIITIIGVLAVILLIAEGKIKIFKNIKIKNIFKVVVFIGMTGAILSSEVNAFSVRWNTSEVYTGSNGVSYVCNNAGKHLCATADHYYNGAATPVDYYTSSSNQTVKSNTTLSQSADNVDIIALDDNYNLVGPYNLRVYTTEASVTGMTLTYTENGTVKQSTDKNIMVDQNGKAVSFNLGNNVNYAFYIKVGVNVEKINSLKVNVTIKNVVKTTTTTYAKYTYSCTSVASSGHQNAHNKPTTATAAGTQGMKTYYYQSVSSSVTYSNVTRTATFGETNIKGRIVITKIDKDKLEDNTLSGIEFTLKMTSGDQEGKYVSPDESGNAVYTDEETKIITDDDGKIEVRLLEPGTYELIETYTPYYGYEELPKTINDSIEVKNGSKVQLTVENERKYVKLSGYVWEDILWEIGKESYVNKLYKDTADDQYDKLLSNIIVKLKDKDGNTIQEAVTDENGAYLFEDVSIDELPNLYIEFTYNGMRFECVDVVDLQRSNSSKSIEGEARTEFNEEYSMITKGQSENSNGSKTHDLSYEQTDTQSSIILGDDLKYGYEGQDENYPVNGVYEQYEITSNTYNAYEGYIDTIKTPEEIRSEGITEITDINLGLKKREQPDISLIKDIYSAKVTINGAHHIYRYGERFTEPNRDIAHNEPQIRFGQERGSQTYTRPLYASDVAYEGDEPLEVKVTYQIEVRNNSTNISSFVNGLSDYYDSKYEYDIVNVGTQIYGEGNGANEGSIVPGSEIKYSQEDIENSEYTKITLSPYIELKPQTEQSIYIELKVQKERIQDLVVKQDEIKEVKLDNVVEITSYGSFEEKEDEQGNVTKKPYAGIDKDSQPDNVSLDERKYEDDTDWAPGLLLILQEERTIDGAVFEDEAIVSGTGQIRQGDGEYTNEEHGIEGITVEVRKTSDGEIAQMYNGSDWVDATDETEADGTYHIEGLIPDDYYITYTWGGQTYTDAATGETTTYTVQDYKGTIVDENIYTAKESNNQWYKETDPRYSDAIDDYNTRRAIDDEIKDITYEKKEQMAQGNLNNNNMKSTTPSFKINLEYDSESSNMNDTLTENAIKNIDFGIVERARQTLALDKYVKHIKIALANGNSIIDTDIELDAEGKIVGQPSYITYIPESTTPAKVKVEIDSELVQGATLETTYGLKVTNVGEIDYTNERYYYYGSGHGETENEMVTLKATEIIDYLDDKLSVEMQTNNTQWNTLTDAQLSDYIGTDTGKYLSNTTERTQHLNTVDRVITTDTLKDIELKPISGQNSIDNITLVGTRLLSNNEETFLENNAEIIHVVKTGGSSLTTIPGNYVPTDLSTSEVDDDYSEEISVVPPTGSNNNTISYIILGISSLTILVAGIILIKRYVIK